MIGNNIKIIRIKNNMSIETLCKKSNMSRSYLSALERGIEDNPSYKKLKSLSIALGCTVSELMKDEECS